MHTSHGSWGSSGGVVYSSPIHVGSVQKYSAPVQKGGVIQKGAVIESEAAPAGDLAPPPVDSTWNRADTEATLTVNVPSEAKIFVNGTATRSNGAVRRYVSRGLTPGFEYTYEIKAELDRDGQAIEETKVVKVRAGASIDVAFELNGTTTPETVVTVNVPEDAKVFLAGNETKGQGAVRVFRTTRLERGAEWAGYTIRVSVERNGKTVSREQTLTLKAGDTPSLTFDFDAPQVASR